MACIKKILKIVQKIFFIAKLVKKILKTKGDFFSAKKMSPCYKVHKKNC